jgi:hypothetical protein
MGFILAIRAFFAILFGLALPDELLLRALEEAEKKKPEALPEGKVEPPQTLKQEPVKQEPVVAPPPKPAGPPPEAAAVRALAVFQTEGRLLDFLSEDIDGYQDAEIGAAVREIHRGCRRALNDHFKLAPVRTEAEESMITVPEGFDPAEIRLVGNVVGKPPFSGTLKHKGWRVEEVRLPNIPEGKGAKVIVPAEVELS